MRCDLLPLWCDFFFLPLLQEVERLSGDDLLRRLLLRYSFVGGLFHSLFPIHMRRLLYRIRNPRLSCVDDQYLSPSLKTPLSQGGH